MNLVTNVKDYGAPSGGDDSDLIRLAIADTETRGTVFFPPGV